MITTRKTACAVVCATVILVTNGEANVVIDNASFVAVSPTSALLIAPTPGRESGFGPQIADLGGGDYEFSTGLIAYNYHTFAAELGSEFTSADAEQWQDALDTGINVVQFSPSETKFFAFWADVLGSEADIPDNDDNYGWISMTYTGTDLEIIDSATALGGGIIVGTYSQIPEPSSLLLLTLGAIAISLYRRP